MGIAVSRQYPHLSDDLDAAPELLERLEALASALGKQLTITSGGRSRAEQAALYADRASNPYPVAPPGTSVHETGKAADVMIGGQPIQNVVAPDTLRKFGLEPLAGDAVHVELAEGAKVDPGGPFGLSLDIGRAILGASKDAANAVPGEAAALAGQVAEGVVKLLFDALGEDGARILLYIVFIAGGVGAIIFGLMRSVGVGVGDVAGLVPAGRAAKAVA